MGRALYSRVTRTALLAALAVVGATVLGCGHSEEEMQAKQREIASLKSQLDAEQDQHKKAQAELDDAKKRVDDLKEQLRKAGVDISNLNANLEEQARALEDYKRRAEQLDQIKKRFELLRSKLQALTKLGLNVTVRNNRMVIQLPGDVLFDSGKRDPQEGRRGHPAQGGRGHSRRHDAGFRAFLPGRRPHRQRSPSRAALQGQLGPQRHARSRGPRVPRRDDGKGGGGLNRLRALERVGLRRHRPGETQRHAREQQANRRVRARRRPQRRGDARSEALTQ
jgi:hypothetical protein